jgi:hypothetical protein
LIDEILLDTDVPGEHVRQKAAGEPRIVVKPRCHLLPLDDEERGGRQRGRGRHAPPLARKAALAEKVAFLKQPNDGLFPPF